MASIWISLLLAVATVSAVPVPQFNGFNRFPQQGFRPQQSFQPQQFRPQPAFNRPGGSKAYILGFAY